jgi:aryl-alcohol dehydrogenase-like predicted oxidoreductase
VLDSLRQQQPGSFRRIAFGLLPLALTGRPPREIAAHTIKVAVDAGFWLIDTADIYGLDDEAFGYTESLLASVVKDVPDSHRPIISTKGGMIRMSDGRRQPNGRPAYLKKACHESLRRLDMDAIDLYQLHRPDPEVPFSDSVGALRELLDEGAIRSAGISNVSVPQLEVARTTLGDGLVAVQNKFSAEDRSGAQVKLQCITYDLSYLAWGPLGGVGRGDGLGQRMPALTQVAGRHGVSPQRVALAWLLAQGSHIVPVVGTRSEEHALDAAAAVDLSLTPEDIQEIDGATTQE